MDTTKDYADTTIADEKIMKNKIEAVIVKSSDEASEITAYRKEHQEEYCREHDNCGYTNEYSLPSE